MSKLLKGAVLLAGVAGVYYYKNPKKFEEHTELVRENVKKLCESLEECSCCSECECEVLDEQTEEKEIFVKLQDSKEKVVNKFEEVKDVAKEKLDTLVSTFKKEEELAEEKAEELKETAKEKLESFTEELDKKKQEKKSEDFKNLKQEDNVEEVVSTFSEEEK